jgi:hypothetical protein
VSLANSHSIVFSERQSAIVGNVNEINACLMIAAAVRISRRTVSIGRILLSFTLTATLGCAIGLTVDEINFISDNFGCITLRALGIGPCSVLQLTADKNRTSFTEAAANEFCRVSPCNDIEEISGGLTFCRLGKTAVDSDRKAANRKAGGRLLQFGIGSQSAYQDHLIKICHGLRLLLD